MQEKTVNENTSAGVIDRSMEMLGFQNACFYGINGVVDVFVKENNIMAFGIQNEEGEYDLLEAYFKAKGEVGIVTTEDASTINFISQLAVVIDAGVAESIDNKEMFLDSVREEFKDASTIVLDNLLGEEPKLTR